MFALKHCTQWRRWLVLYNISKPDISKQRRGGMGWDETFHNSGYQTFMTSENLAIFFCFNDFFAVFSMTSRIISSGKVQSCVLTLSTKKHCKYLLNCYHILSHHSLILFAFFFIIFEHFSHLKPIF